MILSLNGAVRLLNHYHHGGHLNWDVIGDRVVAVGGPDNFSHADAIQVAKQYLPNSRPPESVESFLDRAVAIVSDAYICDTSLGGYESSMRYRAALPPNGNHIYRASKTEAQGVLLEAIRAEWRKRGDVEPILLGLALPDMPKTES